MDLDAKLLEISDRLIAKCTIQFQLASSPTRGDFMVPGVPSKGSTIREYRTRVHYFVSDLLITP